MMHRNVNKSNSKSSKNDGETEPASLAASRTGHREARISLQKVNELLKEQPEDILMKILSPHFGLDLYFSTDRMGQDLTVSFASLLVKALSCNSLREQICKIMLRLVDSNFMTHLYTWVNKTGRDGQYNIDFIENCVRICASILETNPGNFVKAEPIKERLENLIKLRVNSQELMDLYDEKLNFEPKKKTNKQSVKNRSQFGGLAFTLNDHDVDPPEGINELNIVPVLEDLISEKNTYLRPNIIKGLTLNNKISYLFRYR
jgi:hypothetical protein